MSTCEPSGAVAEDLDASVLAIAAPRLDAPSETFVLNHIRTLAPGHTILLCQDHSGAVQFGFPALSGFRSWQAPRSFSGRAANAFWKLRRCYLDPGLSLVDRERVTSFFAKHQPRAVLAEYGITGCLLMRACEEAAVPLYVHFHGYDASRELTDRRRIRQYRALFAKAAGVIAPSRFLKDNLAAAGCSEEKLHVRPCGVDPQAFAPTRRLPQRVLAVGRLVEKKAPHLTIAAFARIAAEFPQARLDLVGDGPLGKRCRSLIAELGLQDRVHLHGTQSSGFVAALMGEASIFVQHSVTAADGDTEGLPVAVLEAMASALPVVATRHSGIAEAVEDRTTGLLVEEHDVAGMADAMTVLLSDPAKGAAMGDAGRRRVLSHYSHEKARDHLRAIMGFPPLRAGEPKPGTAAR